MKRSIVLSFTLFIFLFPILGACAPVTPSVTTVPTAAASAAPAEASPIPSPAITSPSPTPTQLPIFNCDIAFDSDRDGNLEIYSMAPDGSGQTNLSNNPEDDFAPVWSPDGSQIAFISKRNHETGSSLFIMNADGSNPEQISTQGGASFPDWSPAGDKIAFDSNGEIFLYDIAQREETQLTQDQATDEQPKFSPDGQQIAWRKEEEGKFQIFVMNLDGSQTTRVTNGGEVMDLEWSVDGRIFAHWEQPDGICLNCILTVDGKDIQDAGGKGSIQQFLPFWTLTGDRVEMTWGDIRGTGREDITLVGEIFPDIFHYLTSNSGNNRNADTAYQCGPTHGVYPPYEPVASTTGDNPQPHEGSLVIGYTGSLNASMQSDIDKACSELAAQCVKGNSITELADLGVGAIVVSSNKFDVSGSYPAIHEAASERGIPVFLLNAEIHETGIYNLSVEEEIYDTTFSWIFKHMGDQGEFAYYNFGDCNYVQQALDAKLKEYPEIIPIKKSASYDGQSFSSQDITALIASSPNLEAIWSTEKLNDVFWGIHDKSNKRMLYTECLARRDELISWKNVVDAGSPFECIAFIKPGGTGYEGVYAAYYYLNGSSFRTDAFTTPDGNTLRYGLITLTNENLGDWIGEKMDKLLVGEHGILSNPHMSPQEIKDQWFE